MKKISKTISLILACTMVLMLLAGCVKTGDPNQTPNDDTSANQTPSGDASGGDASGGDTTGGDATGGDTTGGDATGGDASDNKDPSGDTVKNDFEGRQSILLIGQSNMAGRGFAEDVEAISDDRIFMINQSNEWVKMQEPIHFDKSAAGVGLAASFAKAFVDTFDCEIGLIPGAFGGTSISDWKVGGTYYNRALEMAKAAQKDSEICAILWHQGESNRSNHSGYAEKLQVILDAFIAELGLDADKIVIITGELREISTNASQRETFHAELNKLSSVYKNYGVASATGLTLNNDMIHFDAPSLRVFGYRYFNIFKTLVTGEGYEFVDDRDHYYVGAQNDPNPNNSGKIDLPSDTPSGGDIGGGNDTATGVRVEIEGNIIADTYISSGSYADNNNAGKTYIGTNKNSSRPLLKYNFANILSDPASQTQKANAKVEFTFTIAEGGENLSVDTPTSAYGFLPGAGVSDADFTTLTWNNCKQGKENAALYRGDATFVYKDQALGDVSVTKIGNTITFTLNYSDVEQFICLEEGDYYGIAVLGFDFNIGGVKFASMENGSLEAPTVSFVYWQ